MKPTLYVANVAEHGFENNPLLERLRARAAKENAPVVAISAALESQIADLDPDDKALFLADMGMTEPGLDRLIRAGYERLGLHTYFTAGPKEVRAWTIPHGATASQAAGVIHTDFEKGFIRAEVIAFADYQAFHGEQGAKDDEPCERHAPVVSAQRAVRAKIRDHLREEYWVGRVDRERRVRRDERGGERREEARGRHGVSRERTGGGSCPTRSCAARPPTAAA